MELESRKFQNVSASREADKVFNPEIKEFFTPPSTGDVISSAPSSVGLADLPSINATVSSAAGTDTATIPASSFSFPVPLTNDLNSAPPDTEYPSFPPFGDSAPSQEDVEPALEEETPQATVQDAFDDMVVLKDGMVTSASMSYERFQATDGHLQESQEGAAPQEAVACDDEETTPEALATEASAEPPMDDVLPDVSVGMETDDPQARVPDEGLALKSETDVTKESMSEAPVPEAEVEGASLTVATHEILVDEQPSPEEGIAEQVSALGVATAEPVTTLEELPAVSSELPSEKPPDEDFPTEKLHEGEPPSDKPPEGDAPSEKPPEVEVPSEVQPKGEPPIEVSDGEETEQEPAMDGYDVCEEDIQAIKGQKVLKKFGKKGYLGDVVDYDPETKWFKVVYEDGDEEDLELVEVKPLLVAPGTTPPKKKKRPRTDGDADEELNRSSKKPKKMVAESSKSAKSQKSKDGGKQVSKKQKGRPIGTKKVSKTPTKPKPKSPGSKLNTPKKASASKKQKKAVKEPKSPAKSGEKAKSMTKSEEVLDSPPSNSPGKSSVKKGVVKYGTRSPSASKGGRSKSMKNAEVSGVSDMSTPEPKESGKAKRLPKSSGKGKGKAGQNLKSPGVGIKEEVTPKSSKAGTKRKIDVEEPVQVSSKRSRKGTTEKEKDTVPGREIDRVGEATFTGKPVRKDFDGTLYDGVVVGYDKKRKYFKVKYEDGDQEDLEWRELELILVPEGKSDVDTEAKPAKVSLLSTLMSQEKKTARSSAKKRKST